MEKMMEFEEWWDEAYGNREIPVPNVAIVKTWASQAFGDARLGTIPAENAVVIPDVREWPEFADGIAIVYTRDQTVWDGNEWCIEAIPRPKPVWVPKDWEPVIFAKPEDDTTLLGVFYKGEIHYGDLYYTATGMRYDKFNPDHIGKPWDAIPGGVE